MNNPNMVMAWGLAVRLLLPFAAGAGEIVIGIAESGSGSTLSWEQVCLANGYAKVHTEWPGGSVLTRFSNTNAFILLSSRFLGGNVLEVEAVSAIDGHTIRLDRFDSRSIQTATMNKTLNSIVADFDLPMGNNPRVAVSVEPVPVGNPQQEQLAFSFRRALAGRKNLCLLPEKKLRSLVVGLQDLSMANIIQLNTTVVGRMLPAAMLLRPDFRSKALVLYTAVDAMSGRTLGSVTISDESDIPQALMKIQQYRGEVDAEPQGNGL